MLRNDFKNLLSQLDNLTHLQKQKLTEKINGNADKNSTQLIESSFDAVKRCPHCESELFSRWGSSNELQRYRCKTCTKTFNALTGSSLSRLRYKELWLTYSRCLTDGLSIKKSANICGIDVTTAFRWRHRFMENTLPNTEQEMTGIVEADETFFTESCKGNKQLTHRKAKKRGKSTKQKRGERVPVLMVRDRSGTVADFVFEEVSKREIHSCLKSIMSEEVVLCSDGNSIYQTFAKDEKIPHKRVVRNDGIYVVDKIFHIQNLNAYISRLKTWMTRFNGVVTKYLANYLTWRKLLETKDKTELSEFILQCALGRNDQQLMRI